MSQLWIVLIVDPEEIAANDNNIYIRFMFIGSILFLVVPTFLTLYQLQREIKMWLNDANMRKIVEPWLRIYVGFLYFLSIIFGGSFSAIDLCNSNLFELSIFYMNLSREYKQVFKNKRVLSIVIFENIPQFIIQILYSFLYSNISVNIITIIAMIFSFLSIILTFFEFSTKKYLFETESGIRIKMEINSKEISNMTRTQFIKRIEYKRYSISNEIAKILSIDFNTIELLKPIPSPKGAILIFDIHIHQSDINTRKTNVLNTLSSDENTERIGQRLKKTYKLLQIPYIMYIDTQLFGLSTVSMVPVTTNINPNSYPGTVTLTSQALSSSSNIPMNTSDTLFKYKTTSNMNMNMNMNMVQVASASTEPQRRRTDTAQTGMLSPFALTPHAVVSQATSRSTSVSPIVAHEFDGDDGDDNSNSNDEMEVVGNCNLPYTLGTSPIQLQAKIQERGQIQSTNTNRNTNTNEMDGEQAM